MRWNPQVYGRYGAERARPFTDLLARIGSSAPRKVVDLGCGTGTLTALLRRRWPAAEVQGIDSAPEMIAAAAEAVDGVTFSLGDVRQWAPAPDVDVVVSNAALQWVPGHRDLLGSWAAALPAGGWLAVQVPGNFRAPSHTLMRSIGSSPRWAASLDGVLEHESVGTTSSYASVLLAAGLAVDAWETTYLHVLQGDDPVLEWLRGSALRPALAALSPEEGQEFSAVLASALRCAYPATEHGTLFPFRRIFAVAHRP